jgi:hypothetical protein
MYVVDAHLGKYNTEAQPDYAPLYYWGLSFVLAFESLVS